MDDKVIVALAGFGGAIIGAVIGSIATIAGQVINHCLTERSKTRADRPRKTLLKQMLNDKRHEWRNLSTLMHVIGTDEETAKRLLIEIGARASENGEPIWALMSNKPLPDAQ